MSHLRQADGPQERPIRPILGCSDYPDCKTTLKLDKQGNVLPPKPPPEATGLKCYKCKEGELVIRQSKRGPSSAATGSHGAGLLSASNNWIISGNCNQPDNGRPRRLNKPSSSLEARRPKKPQKPENSTIKLPSAAPRRTAWSVCANRYLPSCIPGLRAILKKTPKTCRYTLVVSVWPRQSG